MQRSGALLLLVLAACGGPSAPSVATVATTGGIEKGPFLLGSTIVVSMLDGALAPTGAVFNTETTDDEGHFALGLPPGPISVEATGFYYNEISGGLSSAPTVLRAFDVVAPGAAHTTFVNVLTHLAHPRIQHLVAGGATLAEATTQAEAEVRAALHVGVAGIDPGAATSLSELGGDTDRAAYLLAVSAVLMNAATIEAGSGSVDAALQSLLNRLGADSATDGTLEAAPTTALLEAQDSLDAALVTRNMAARLALIGSTAAVPDVTRILDRDQDGVADRADNCPHVANPDQLDANADGLGDACEVVLCGDGFHVPGEVCFVPHPTGAILPMMTVRGDLVTGDFDGDGHRDVAYDTLAIGAAPGVTVLLGDGAGGLGAPLFTSMAAPGGMAVARVDGDAIDDLVIDANPERTMLGAAGGALVPVDSSAVTGTRSSRTLPHLFDVGGQLDLVDAVATQVGFYPATGDGHFAAAAHTVSIPVLFDAVPGDFDGDGFVDLAAITDDHDDATDPQLVLPLSLVLVSGGPSLGFATRTSVALAPAGNRPTTMITGDLDGDGRLDVVVGVQPLDAVTPGTVTVLRANGDGTFTRHDRVMPAGQAASRLAVADLDGDGKQDVIVDFGGLFLLRGDGSGALASAEPLLPPGNHPFAIADMNGDGAPDLIVSEQTGGGYGIGLVVYLAGGY